MLYASQILINIDLDKAGVYEALRCALSQATVRRPATGLLL